MLSASGVGAFPKEAFNASWGGPSTPVRCPTALPGACPRMLANTAECEWCLSTYTAPAAARACCLRNSLRADSLLPFQFGGVNPSIEASTTFTGKRGGRHYMTNPGRARSVGAGGGVVTRACTARV